LDADNDETLRTLKLAGVQKSACLEKGTGKIVPISFYTTIAVLAAF
jgi:hypothetical protein